MRVQLLPSTFDSQGQATLEQRLTCFLIDESVAVDAGSIALALTTEQRQKVRDIIVEQLGVNADQVTTEAKFIEDLGADSLDTVELVMAFEEEFSVEVPDEDAEKLQTVGDVIKYIQERAKPKEG